ncbi:S8 family serine peptidase [Sphingomonas carotinifaciens]|uniref:S8 family serine peptidase n=1 Tax=Sphingomonas carotinifaciens TaxID=1166323 RepID=A0A1G7RV36_9SPHN|nr:S8 family serine peptidase [Sphingomonas carotinifaciens]MBB4088142.1 Ca2+-binding RTX toxin-like protein [Sphingomonas carotinifaciens]MWC44727.1 S8 family serine peptidase [Sphingomonas carotinifaciens]SDG14673.1 Subtilase family protein [Sphingomonas carotinifaciens]
MATKYKTPPLGRAYDYNTGKLVNNINDLYNPQGGTSSELMAQWHLKQLGDIGTVWNDFTGKGVSVGVYDEGTQQTHWDLDNNYDASKHVVIDGTVLDGGVPTGAHGTSVAGLIAAERNGRGGVGVAYDATVTGVNIFDPASPIFVNGTNGDALQSALMQANQFDVVNHSWGGAGDYTFSASRSNPASFSSLLSRTFEHAAETGRDGLGTITVMAAGNDNKLGQAHAGVTDRHAIAVGAYRQVDGVSSYYSNSGPHLLVSAPSNDYAIVGGTGLVATDLLGTDGYNWSVDPTAANDYTDQFGGTSGATPIVSGVVSLMLDANENLGWRDVQNILAASAKMPVAYGTGPVVIDLIQQGVRGPVLLNGTSFGLVGQDANWNGGAHHYSNDYGYGAVDAYNAVRMAEVWGLFGESKTSANEVKISQEVAVNMTSSSDGVVGDRISFNNELLGNPLQKSFEVTGNVAVEHIDLTVNFYYGSSGNIQGTDLGQFTSPLFNTQIKLIAPDGSSALVPIAGTIFGGQGGAVDQFTLSFSGLRGVDSQGTWTVDFSALDFDGFIPITTPFGPFNLAAKVDNKLTVEKIKLDIYGSEATSDDVYTYTNEFFDMLAIKGEGARKTLTDTDGGIDWINAAAVSTDVKLSLVGGQATYFDGGKAFTIGRTSVIEGAVTGDGNDTLIGNRFDNHLYGMRGDDTLNGGAGNDILFGGTGADNFLFDNRGTSGKDTVLDWSSGDMIATQTALRGQAGNGMVTVAKNAMLLLDGLLTGDAVTLSQNSGAVLQAQGQKDGYFWYSYVSGTNLDPNDVIREVSFQPERTAAGSVDSIATVASQTADVGAPASLTGPLDEHGSFYLYDAMAGSMSGGVLLHA